MCIHDYSVHHSHVLLQLVCDIGKSNGMQPHIHASCETNKATRPCHVHADLHVPRNTDNADLHVPGNTGMPGIQSYILVSTVLRVTP